MWLYAVTTQYAATLLKVNIVNIYIKLAHV